MQRLSSPMAQQRACYRAVGRPSSAAFIAPSPAKRAAAPCKRRVACNYKVTLKMPDGVKEIEVDEDTFLVDAAEENGFELPYSCRSGSCATCTGKVESGTINQDDQTMLDEDQVGAGFALLCVTSPTSDCVILTHQEEALF